ncbi:unnamed protein product, partial [Hymenolepis diminuta]
QSHGTTLVLRYPQQQQQKTGEQQFDPSQGSIVDASTGGATGNTAIALVNGNCQFQQAPQYQQQQRLVMLSSGGKNTCYEHLNDPSSNSVNGSSTTSGGTANSVNGNVSSGDQVNSVPETQTQTITTAFQQTSGSVAQSAPAGAMAVLVRGANSQSTLQFLIPQPDGTMVLQPATMQTQFCNRGTAAPTSTVSLLSQPSSQIQPSQHQQTPAGSFSQPLLQTGFISVPRGDDATSIFHSPAAGGICAGGQFTTSAEDGSGNASTN